MKHLKTFSQFESELTDDLTNRLQEISRYRDVVNAYKATLTETPLLRASVTILYAHWEGFAKNSAEKYVRYVLSQQHISDDLCSAIVAYYLDPSNQGSKIVYGRTGLRETIAEVRRKGRIKVAPKSKIRIETASNLSYEITCRMATAIGVSGIESFLDRDFMDGSLLAKRNAIAHGESAPIAFVDVDKYRDKTIDMMRKFKDRLLDAAIKSEFLRKNEAL